MLESHLQDEEAVALELVPRQAALRGAPGTCTKKCVPGNFMAGSQAVRQANRQTGWRIQETETRNQHMPGEGRGYSCAALRLECSDAARPVMEGERKRERRSTTTQSVPGEGESAGVSTLISQ
jgi:hypothetical protein